MFSRFAAFTENPPVIIASGASIEDELRGLDMQSLCDKAMALMMAQKYLDALPYLDQAVRRPYSPEDDEKKGWHRAAYVFRALDNLYMSTYKVVVDRAVQDLRAAHNIDEGHPVSLMCKSLILASQGNYDESKNVYNRALHRIGLDRLETNLLLGLRLVHGEILRLLKLNMLALEDFEEANRLKPGNPFILSRMGLTYASSREPEKAREFLREAIEQCKLQGNTAALIKDSAQRTFENVEATQRGEVPPHGRYRSSSASSAGSAAGSVKSGGGVAAPAASQVPASGPQQSLEEGMHDVRRSIRMIGFVLGSDASETTPSHHEVSPHPRHRATPSGFGAGSAAALAASPRQLPPIPPRHSPRTLPKAAVSAPESGRPTVSAPKPAVAQALPAAPKGVSVQERMKAFTVSPKKPHSPSPTGKPPVFPASGSAAPQASRPASATPKTSPNQTTSPSAAELARGAQQPRGGSAGIAQLLRQQAAEKSQGPAPG